MNDQGTTNLTRQIMKQSQTHTMAHAVFAKQAVRVRVRGRVCVLCERVSLC